MLLSVLRVFGLVNETWLQKDVILIPFLEQSFILVSNILCESVFKTFQLIVFKEKLVG